MIGERGLDVDHSTAFRWVQRYAPEINKRVRPRLKLSDTSYRVDETYIKVGKSGKYLYRAIDSTGSTIEFMLPAKRDLPFSISGDKNVAYPETFSDSQAERVVPQDC